MVHRLFKLMEKYEIKAFIVTSGHFVLFAFSCDARQSTRILFSQRRVGRALHTENSRLKFSQNHSQDHE